MPRKRMIDPMFWDDPDIIRLTHSERLLFIGLFNLADDYGHMSGMPEQLNKWIFGYDGLSVEAVSTMLGHILAICANVVPYTVSGRQYLWLVRWERRQDLRFRAEAQYPCHVCGAYHKQKDFDECVGLPVNPAYTVLTQICASTTKDIAQPLPPDYVTSCSDTSCIHDQPAPNGASDKKPKGTKRNTRLYDEDFAKFWAAYPRRIGKTEAEGAYAAARKRGVDPEALLTGAQNYATACTLKGTADDYICHPRTYLRNDRYKDYQTAPKFSPPRLLAVSGRTDRPAPLSTSAAERTEAYDPAKHGF